MSTQRKQRARRKARQAFERWHSQRIAERLNEGEHDQPASLSPDDLRALDSQVHGACLECLAG